VTPFQHPSPLDTAPVTSHCELNTPAERRKTRNVNKIAEQPTSAVASRLGGTKNKKGKPWAQGGAADDVGRGKKKEAATEKRALKKIITKGATI